jgi:UDP-glucose 4-epimerase
MTREKRKILVTGGAGLIGSHIVDQIVVQNVLGNDREVIVLDNFTRGRHENLAATLDSDRVQVVEGDIRDRTLLAALMADVDLVFHQAAIRITKCAEEPRLALEVLVDGTFNILESCVNAGVRKVIAASSASVYGMAELFPTAETHHAWNNRTLYGASKAFNEGLLRSFHDMHGLDYVGLRYFNVYGPRMDIHGLYTEVLVRWMELIENGDAPLIHGDGSATMDFVHAEDIAKANICAAQSEVTDEIFNVGRGEETSLNDLLTTLLRVMGSSLEPQYGPESSVNGVPRHLADTRKASSLLGYRAEISLEEGLRSLVDWWRAEKAPERQLEVQSV